jgi:hypothetical protein
MKQRIFLIVLFGLICSVLGAQVVGDESILPVILHGDYQGTPIGTGNFILPDGTMLDYAALKQKLLTVPDNERYIQHAEGWEITAWVSAALAVGFFVGDMVYSFNRNLPYADGMITAFRAGELLSIIWAPLFKTFRDGNLNRAVKNYNLYIMGIPIPTAPSVGFSGR